jgi:putative transcriptional regulator
VSRWDDGEPLFDGEPPGDRDPREIVTGRSPATVRGRTTIFHMSPAADTGDEAIHNRLAVLRAERSLSRRELAEAIGVHYQTVGYLERGEYSPSLALAFRIARFFDLPVEAVFSDRPFQRMSSVVYDRGGDPS